MPDGSRKKRRRSETSRRRVPTQERSVQLVEAVLKATAQVLAEVGLERTSTNKIARRAGVSVGSIYQYFPDKEALIDAVVSDRRQRLEALITERMMSVMGRPYPEAAETILRASVDFYASEPELTRVLMARSNPVSDRPNDRLAAERMHQVAKTYLLRYENELEIEDFDIAAELSTGVVGHFAPRIALQRTIGTSSETLISEVVRMLAEYVGAKRGAT